VTEQTSRIIESHEIMQLLPHRYPFLLVDRVLNFEEGKWLTAIKNISVNEPCFTGHFPGNPILPGVLILEAMAQAMGILAFTQQPKFIRRPLLKKVQKLVKT